MFAEAKSIFNQKAIEIKYIIANVVVFLAIKIGSFLALPYREGYNIGKEWLSVPASLDNLITQPWTLFSYMFTHTGFIHLLSNMIWLYFGGRIFSDLLGKDKFIKTYWIGGLVGALFYIIAYNIFPQLETENSILLGASASVMAVFIGLVVYVPDYTVMLPFIGPAKLKYIAIVFIILMLPGTRENQGGHLAHLGGFTWGVLWASYLKRGRDLGSWFDNTRAYFSQGAAARSQRRAAKKSVAKKRPAKRNNDLPNQQEIDRILDKVGKSGYESLSAEEKNILFNASK